MKKGGLLYYFRQTPKYFTPRGMCVSQVKREKLWKRDLSQYKVQ